MQLNVNKKDYLTYKGIDFEMIPFKVQYELYKTKSQAIKHFNMENEIFVMFCDSLRDKQFMTLMLFNNDCLKIPPTCTFTSYYEIDDLSDFEKRSIGDWFRVIFLHVFKYKTKQRKRRTNSLIENTLIFID